MSSLAIRGISNKLIDCYGSEYEIIRMPGTGFCGFHSVFMTEWKPVKLCRYYSRLH